MPFGCLLWSIFINQRKDSMDVEQFFLVCVLGQFKEEMVSGEGFSFF